MDSSRGVLSGTMDRFKMVCKLADFPPPFTSHSNCRFYSTLLGIFLIHVFLLNTFLVMAD
jgi:hypothetical protein